MKTKSHQSSLSPSLERQKLVSFLISFCLGLVACSFVVSLESNRKSHGQIIVPTPVNQADASPDFNDADVEDSRLDFVQPKKATSSDNEASWSQLNSFRNTYQFDHQSLVGLKIRLQI